MVSSQTFGTKVWRASNHEGVLAGVAALLAAPAARYMPRA
jgi:hypothetical protein